MSKEEGNAEAPAQGADTSPGGKKEGDIYENRGTKKVVRLITVMAYMFSVSFVAIVLSAYYLFLWEPPNPRLIHRAHHLIAEPRIEFLIGDPPDSALNESRPDPNEIGTDREANRTTRIDPRVVGFLGAVYSDDENYDDRVANDDSLLRLRHSLIQNLLRSRLAESSTDEQRRDKSGREEVSVKTKNTLSANQPTTEPSFSGYEANDLRRVLTSLAPEIIDPSDPEDRPTIDTGLSNKPVRFSTRIPGNSAVRENRHELAGTRTNDSIDANIYRNADAPKTVRPFQSKNNVTTMRMYSKESYPGDTSTAHGISLAGEKENGAVGTEDVRFFPTRGIEIPRTKEFDGETEKPGSGRQTNLAINYEDTQSEKSTVARADLSERTEEPQGQENSTRSILTMLTSTTEAESSSTGSSLVTTFDHAQTDLSPVQKATERET